MKINITKTSGWDHKDDYINDFQTLGDLFGWVDNQGNREVVIKKAWTNASHGCAWELEVVDDYRE